MTGPASALDRIRATFRDLDEWGQRSAEVIVPAAESDLAADDAESIGWLTSQLAAAGLAGGRNHLNAVRVHVEARHMFPEATGSLIRGALLGAAQAVWILAPADRATRMKRSRIVTAEVVDNHRKFLADLLQIDSQHEGTRLVHDHVTSRLVEVRAKQAELGETMRYSSTSMIEHAALAAYGPGFDVEARAEWRRFSGNVHGLPWAVLGVSGTDQTSPRDDDGFATFVAGGSFDDVLNGYLLTHGLLQHGWALFDKRSAP